MNLVDSSGWMAYLGGGAPARHFAPVIEDVRALLVPTVGLVDVYRRALRHLERGEALRIAVAMQQGRLVGLSAGVGMLAADLGAEHDLSLADSVALATARAHGAVLWTRSAKLASVGGIRCPPTSASAIGEPFPPAG